MELRQNLSDNLKVLRQAREATLEGFSLDIGISRSTLQEIEAGKANACLLYTSCRIDCRHPHRERF